MKRHRAQRHTAGIINAHSTELGQLPDANLLLKKLPLDFPNKERHVDNYLIRRRMERDTLSIQAPLLLSREKVRIELSDPTMDTEATSYYLRKVNAETGVVVPFSSVQVYFQSDHEHGWSGLAGLSINDEVLLELLERQYNEQFELGIVFLGQMPGYNDVIS